MTPEQRKLVEDHLEYADRVVAKIVHGNRAFAPAFDDMHSAALLGLCEAARRFVPARGTFATYAWWWMRMEAYKAAFAVLNPVDHWNHQGRKADVDGVTEEGEQMRLENWLPPSYQEPDPEIEGLGRLFDHLAGCHSERDTAIYRAVIIEEETMAATGRTYGISRARIQQIIASVEASVERFGQCVRREAA